MNTITTTGPTTPGALARLAGFVGIAALRFAEYLRAYGKRRDLENLANLDDRMLADIGLTRGDLRDAAAEPLWRDPTAVLVMRRRERRTARWASPLRPLSRPIAAPSLVPGLAPPMGTAQVPTRYH